MDAKTQLRRYEESVGRERLVAAWAREGRNAEGVCRECSAKPWQSHKRVCSEHPHNRQRAVVKAQASQ